MPGNGTIVVDSIAHNGSSGVRVLGLDKGPGIRDLTTALRDGYSTAGTGGNGLGAIKRLSNAFDIYTAPGLGTAVLAEFWPEKKRPCTPSPIEVGVVSVPIKGEDVCGDGWGARKTADSMSADGGRRTWTRHSGVGRGARGGADFHGVAAHSPTADPAGFARCDEENARSCDGCGFAESSKAGWCRSRELEILERRS